jgi:hypothetical protein
MPEQRVRRLVCFGSVGRYISSVASTYDIYPVAQIDGAHLWYWLS